MAEFLDVEMYHEADEPPSLYFKDDHGETVAVGMLVKSEEEGYGWVQTFRIQHDEIEKL